MPRNLICSVSLLGLMYAGSALADTPQLKGDYAFTGSATCLFAPGSSTTPSNPTPGVALSNSGFDPQLRPIDGHVFSSSSDVEGIHAFNGDGTGSVRGTSVFVTVPPTPGPTYPHFVPDAGSVSFSFSFTYTVNNDGTFSTQMVPGTYLETFLTGGRAGQTASVDQLANATGLIGKDAKTLTLSIIQPQVEVVSYSNGDVWPRICHRSRVLAKIGDGNDN
jgi:hypothetical protein